MQGKDQPQQSFFKQILQFTEYKHLFFFVVIGTQMLIYNYPYILKTEPRNHHAFRQYDCLSFAQSFYNNRATLAQPCLNNLGTTRNGKTASEFPLIQYLVGNIWKVTGIHTEIYRIVNLCFLLLGLFFAYKLFLLEFKNKFLAILICALIYTSPILSYYGISVLSDIQALSLSTIGFYFFYKWRASKNKKDFLIFILLFLLAGLLKISSTPLYFICLLCMLLQGFEAKKLTREVFTRQNLITFVFVLTPMAVWLLWYSYAKSYNLKNNDHFFLLGLLPVWEADANQLIENTTALLYNTLPAFISPFILFVTLAAFVTCTFFYMKEKTTEIILLSACFVFFIIYILLFFQALNIHDYYLINLLGILMVAIFFIFKIIHPQIILYRRQLVFITAFSTIIFTYTTGIKTWKKINLNVREPANTLAFNKDEQKSFFWIYWQDREICSILEDKTIDLEKIGVLKHDTILCVGDKTINRSLYLLNRVGYTDYNRPFEDVSHFIKRHPNIQYLVLLDPEMKDSPETSGFVQNKVFERKNLSVYKLK